MAKNLRKKLRRNGKKNAKISYLETGKKYI